MSTRRQILEEALCVERRNLWLDLDTELTEGTHTVDSARIEDLVDRIRRCCDALGYTTPWTEIPFPSLNWLPLVETIPACSLTPTLPSWPELVLIMETQRLHPVTLEAVEAHALTGSITYQLGDPDAE